MPFDQNVSVIYLVNVFNKEYVLHKKLRKLVDVGTYLLLVKLENDVYAKIC